MKSVIVCKLLIRRPKFGIIIIDFIDEDTIEVTHVSCRVNPKV